MINAPNDMPDLKQTVKSDVRTLIKLSNIKLFLENSLLGFGIFPRISIG